jgi:hypothetical protein
MTTNYAEHADSIDKRYASHKNPCNPWFYQSDPEQIAAPAPSNAIEQSVVVIGY